MGFLGGAQIDRFGNLNSTVIGPYDKPKVRLPGSGGATEIATSCQRIYVVMRHNPRAFVDKLAFVTSLGHGVTGRERRAMGIETEGPVLLVTDLCTMAPAAESKEFEVVTLHPGITREQVRENTGWDVRFAARGRRNARARCRRARGAEGSQRADGASARRRVGRVARAGSSLLACWLLPDSSNEPTISNSQQPTASS